MKNYIVNIMKLQVGGNGNETHYTEISNATKVRHFPRLIAGVSTLPYYS